MAEFDNDRPQDPLDGPTLPIPEDNAAEVGQGAQIGPYKLLSVLGEGGYGIVYLAEQQQPIRRRAALKVIKPGMDSKQVIARFEAERQALAMLDHPNIAHVFDGGTTHTGRPYFVMEYVKGVPITEHCDKLRLGIEDRLELFLQVCDGVQHAHQKGIIHRDIKPSNILVSIEGNRAIPMIIDFGVAKALNQSLTDRTLVTEQGQMTGTPEYMSPEQADLTGQDIDTRCDVYSMGVVLYELLAGVLPFDPQDLRSGGMERLRQIIREAEPRTPSTRLVTIAAEESARLAQLRRTDARALRRRLGGDLDWITLKAMEKDRTRRYASVGEFAADITRHLRDEPVVAGPPGALYRMQKFVRRHRALVRTLAAVLIVFLAGFAGIVVFAVKADRQARIAEAVTQFLGEDLLGAVSLQQAMNQEVTVRSIVDAAAARLEGQFADKPLVEASIRQYLGQTYIELGDYRQAKPHLERALELRREKLGDKDLLTLDSMSQLGRLYLLQGRYEQAEPLLTEAMEARRRLLGPEHVDTLETSIWLGLAYRHSYRPGSLEKAEALLSYALESCNRLFGKGSPITLEAMYGLAFVYFGGPEQEGKALPLCLEGWEIARQVLGEGHRLTYDFMVMGAWFEAWKSQFEQAERHAKIGIETGKRILGEAHPQTILAMGALGRVYAMQHLFGKAEEQMAEAARLGGETLGKGNAWTLQDMCMLGYIRMMQGKYAQAEQHFMDVRASGRPVYTDSFPVVRDAATNILGLHVMQEQGDAMERWCREELDRLAQADDGNRLVRAGLLNELAWRRATYPSAAIRDGAKAIENALSASELTDHKDPLIIDTLAAAYAEAGDFDAAVREASKAVDLAASRDDTPLAAQHLEHHLELFKSGQVIRECILSSRARSMLREAKYQSTEVELTAALNSARKYLPEAHPEIQGCILGFIELYEVWNKPEQAEKWRAELATAGR